MGEEGKTERFSFIVNPFLELPSIQAPKKEGFASATIQFLIPNLAVNAQTQNFLEISKYCGIDVYKATLKSYEKPDAILVSIIFYVPRPRETNIDQEIENQARLLIERFMGILSFYVGVKLFVANAQLSVPSNDGMSQVKLEPKCKAFVPTIKFILPEKPFESHIPSENIFSALFWLRRGLANRDSLETYASLMVCLQSIARELIKLPADVKCCPKCKAEIATNEPGITALVRELVINKIGAPKNLFDKLWAARNAVVAHGNKTINADVLLEITELKFIAITLCFDGIKLAMGMTKENAPFPNQANFVTPASLYLD